MGLQVCCQALAKPEGASDVVCYCLEADELWSFVGAKDCPVWVWLAIERASRLIVGFHVRDKDEVAAKGFWLGLRQGLKEKAIIFTDGLPTYQTAVPKGQHQKEGKEQTTIIERFNNTMRQRCSRLVR